MNTAPPVRLWNILTNDTCLLMIINFINIAQNYYTTPTVTKALQGHGIPAATICTLFLFRFVGAWIGRYAAGRFGDEKGHKLFAISLTAMLGILLVFFPFAERIQVWWLVLLVILQDLFACGAANSINTLLTNLCQEKYRARILGVNSAFGQLSILSTPVSLWLYDLHPQIWGLPIIILVLSSAILLCTVEEPQLQVEPKQANQLAGQGKGIWKYLDRGVFSWSLTTFGAVLAHGATTVLIPMYADEINVEHGNWMFYVSYTVALIAVRLAVGKWIDQSVERGDHHAQFVAYLSAYALVIVGLLSLAGLPNSIGFIAVGSLVGFGYPFVHLLGQKLSLLHAVNPQQRGRAVATYWMPYEFYMQFGRVMIIGLEVVNFQALWVILSLPAVLSVLLLWNLRRKGAFQEAVR